MASNGSPTSKAPAYPIQSVGNALLLLRRLGEEETLTVTGSAQLLEVAPSTAHRLLAMLAYHGFIEEVGNRRGYRSGPALLNLGLSAVQRLDLRTIARTHLEELSRQVEETVNLLVLEGASIRFVDCVEGPRALRVAGRVGLRRPATTVSVGKAILAQFPPAELDLLYPPQEPLPVLTSDTVADRAALDEQLAEIRRRGYATNFRESDPEIRAIGVALSGRMANLLAGVAISAPVSRLPDENVPHVAAAVMETVRRIERALGLLVASTDEEPGTA